MSFIYRILRKIPVFGTLLKIANIYVYDGDLKGEVNFAPFGLWMRNGFWRMLIALSVTLATVYEIPVQVWLNCGLPSSRADMMLIVQTKNWWEVFGTPSFSAFSIDMLRASVKAPGAISITVFPGLLGFGIGAYALVFAASGRFLLGVETHIQRQIKLGKRRAGSSLMLHAGLAYPLMVLAVATGWGVLQQAFSSSLTILLLAWWSLWYGLVVLIEMLGTMFAIGEEVWLNRLDEVVDQKNETPASDGISTSSDLGCPTVANHKARD